MNSSKLFTGIEITNKYNCYISTKKLIQNISERIRDGERRELFRQLENNEVSPDEEAEILQRLLDQEREDQGLT